MKNHLALLTLLFAAACGSDSTTSVSDFEAKLANALCTTEVTCNQAPDVASCVTALRIDSTASRTLDADIKAGIVKFDASLAEKCVDEISALTCDVNQIFNAPDCANVTTGTVANQGACDVNNECVSGDCLSANTGCDSSTECCPGTCNPTNNATLVPVGGACSSSTSSCVEGAYCKTSGGSGTCTAAATTAGAACDTDASSCASPLYCDLGSGSGTCKLPPSTGAACVTTDAYPCLDERDYCDATSLVCTRLIAVGAACSDAKPCVHYAACTNSVCVADLKVGDACSDLSDAPSCPGSSECVSNVCTQLTAAPSCR